jgi:hypothetical protein
LGGAVFGYPIIRGTLLDNPGFFDCAGSTAEAHGHNLDSDGSCGFIDPTDLSNVDPLLGPLQNNGGPSSTHALQLGSPAIDAIPRAACTEDPDGDPGTPEVKLTKDQRDGMRPREGNGSAPSGCDIGAYKVAACADGLDNDGDGRVDFDGGVTAGLTPLASPDPTCTPALGAAESAPPSSGCGVGPELLLLGALLAAAPLVDRAPPSTGSLTPGRNRSSALRLARHSIDRPRRRARDRDAARRRAPARLLRGPRNIGKIHEHLCAAASCVCDVTASPSPRVPRSRQPSPRTRSRTHSMASRRPTAQTLPPRGIGSSQRYVTIDPVALRSAHPVQNRTTVAVATHPTGNLSVRGFQTSNARLFSARWPPTSLRRATR